jgi:hypothetical protein
MTHGVIYSSCGRLDPAVPLGPCAARHAGGNGRANELRVAVLPALALAATTRVLLFEWIPTFH